MAVLAIAAVILGAAGWWWFHSQPGVVTVARVLDARTIEVSQDGATRTIRLGNVVVPSGEDCLAQEATAHLASLLPPATEITLDPVVDDAATAITVHVGDLVVNAELARAGYAAAAGPDGPARDQVSTAQRQSRNGLVGIYSSDVECAPVAQVTAFQDSVASTAGTRPAETDDAWLEDIEKLIADGDRLSTTLSGESSGWPWIAFTSDDLESLRGAVAAANEVAAQVRDAYLAEEDARQEAARQAAEEAARREAARLAAEEAARQAEEERRAAEAEKARQAEADRAAAAAQPGYRWSNPVAEEVGAQFGLTVRYVSTTACGSSGHISDNEYGVAGCYTTGADYFELTTTALWERADDELVRFVAYHEAMHWLTWKTCGPSQYPRLENVTDAMTFLHGGLTSTSGGYGYTDADLTVAEGILAGTCPT